MAQPLKGPIKEKLQTYSPLCVYWKFRLSGWRIQLRPPSWVTHKAIPQAENPSLDETKITSVALEGAASIVVPVVQLRPPLEVSYTARTRRVVPSALFVTMSTGSSAVLLSKKCGKPGSTRPVAT